MEGGKTARSYRTPAAGAGRGVQPSSTFQKAWEGLPPFPLAPQGWARVPEKASVSLKCSAVQWDFVEDKECLVRHAPQPQWRQAGSSHPQHAALGGLAPPLFSLDLGDPASGMWCFCELCSDLVFPAFLIFQSPVDHPPQVSP